MDFLVFAKILPILCVAIILIDQNAHGQVCDPQVDLTFIMDSSTTGTTDSDYENMKALLNDMLDENTLVISFATVRSKYLDFNNLISTKFISFVHLKK